MGMLRLNATMPSLDKMIFLTLQESAEPVGIAGGVQGKNQMPPWVIKFS